MVEIESAAMVKSLQSGPKVMSDWELALIVRKATVMEVSNDTGFPTMVCLSIANVPQETKLGAKNRKWSYKQ